MKIISIAFKDLLITLKDRKALALIILMPIVLIFVLGMSLSYVFKDNGVTVKRFDVAVVDNDGGNYAGHFMDFLKSEDIKKMINLKELSMDEAMGKVKNGDLPAVIVIPEGYSSDVKEGRKTSINIFTDPGSPMRAEIVESLVKSYTGVGSSVEGAIDAAVDVFDEYNLDGHMIAAKIVEAAGSSGSVEFKESNLNRKQGLSAMQYYSAAMLAMYILFVGMLGTSSIMEEREQKNLLRLMSTTVSKRSILAGKVLGLFLLGIFDVSVLILFTRLVFGVSWGNSIIGLIVLSCAMIFAASGFAMFIASMFKTLKAMDSASPPMIMVMSFLGGSMYPIFQMPPVIQTAGKLTLNNWAMRGYFNLMLGNGFNSVITNSVVLLAMGAAFLTLGVCRLSLD